MKDLTYILCKKKYHVDALRCRAKIDFGKSHSDRCGIPIIMYKCDCTQVENSKKDTFDQSLYGRFDYSELD